MRRNNDTEPLFSFKTTLWTHSIHIIVPRTYVTLVFFFVQIALALALFFYSIVFL